MWIHCNFSWSSADIAILIYNWKDIFNLCSTFKNPWNFLRAESHKSVFCSWGDFWKAPRSRKDGAWPPGEPTVLLGLELLVPLSPGEGGEGLGTEVVTNAQWFNQFCLCNEASMKTQKDRVWELLARWTPGDVRGGLCLERAWTLHAFPQTSPSALLLSVCSQVISFYNKLVIQ